MNGEQWVEVIVCFIVFAFLGFIVWRVTRD